MDEPKIGGIIKTAVVTAFTLAAALIWKDVISHAIEVLFPTSILLYEFLAAIIVTILAIIAIYLILKTEVSAENFFRRMMEAEEKGKKQASKIRKKLEKNQ